MFEDEDFRDQFEDGCCTCCGHPYASWGRNDDCELREHYSFCFPEDNHEDEDEE